MSEWLHLGGLNWDSAPQSQFEANVIVPSASGEAAQAGPTEEAVGVEGSYVLAHVGSLADRWSYR